MNPSHAVRFPRLFPVCLSWLLFPLLAVSAEENDAPRVWDDNWTKPAAPSFAPPDWDAAVPPDTISSARSPRMGMGVEASALYVFNTVSSVEHQEGWGGSLAFYGFEQNYARKFYLRVGVELVYFETTGDYWRDSVFFSAEAQRYGLLANVEGGLNLGDFQLGALVGLGGGATHTDGTHKGNNGTSADLLVQMGLRLNYSPVEHLNIFVGYRLMYNAPANGSDDCGYYDSWGIWHDCNCSTRHDKKDYPSFLSQMVEVGVSWRF